MKKIATPVVKLGHLGMTFKLLSMEASLGIAIKNLEGVIGNEDDTTTPVYEHLDRLRYILTELKLNHQSIRNVINSSIGRIESKE